MARLITTEVYGDLTVTGEMSASRVWNAVYNDLVDFIVLADDEELKYGYVYFQDTDGARLAYKRCQMGIIGMASDTYGFALGIRKNVHMVPIGLCGWVLAKVDDYYPIGTPLTNNEFGELTKMQHDEKINYPERILATMGRKEPNEIWNKNVKVNGRYWVKIKG